MLRSIQEDIVGDAIGWDILVGGALCFAVRRYWLFIFNSPVENGKIFFLEMSVDRIWNRLDGQFFRYVDERWRAALEDEFHWSLLSLCGVDRSCCFLSLAVLCRCATDQSSWRLIEQGICFLCSKIKEFCIIWVHGEAVRSMGKT